jgi:hypothetical protein
VRYDPIKKKLARIETAIAALLPERKVLRVIVDQGEGTGEKMKTALLEHLARYPEDAGCDVADFDWITRVMLPGRLSHDVVRLEVESDLPELGLN